MSAHFDSASTPLAFPVAAGDWRYTADGMCCVLPRRALRVQAPRELLLAIHAQCSGRRTWDEVQSRLAASWGMRASIFLADLASKGMLVEAGSLLSLQAQLGWTPQPYRPLLTEQESLIALREQTRQSVQGAANDPEVLHPGDSALKGLLDSRSSSNTFADAALSLQSLVNILWALYGVVGPVEDGFRRTVPSGGGLHALRWHLALLRDTGNYSRGLYEMQYRAPAATGKRSGGLVLCGRAGSPETAWGTLLQPAVLSFAHAVVYPWADMTTVEQKYGNRSLTLVLIELGHALQNGALAAQTEDAASIVRGDTVEAEVQRLLSLDSTSYPLPAFVVGKRPTDDELCTARAATQRFQLRSVPNSSRRLQLETQLCVAGPITMESGDDAPLWTAGRSADARLSAIKAEAEAWERIGWSTPGNIAFAKPKELPDAVDPALFVAYSHEQYRRADFPYEPLASSHRYPWVQGTELGTGRSVSLMAQTVYALSSLSPQARARPYTNASTSGVAAWTDAAGAVERALAELIERDAFARAWLERRGPPLLPHNVLSPTHRARLDALSSAGYEVQVRLLPSTWLPVVSVGVRNSSLLSLTTGAGYSIGEAVESALRESENRIQQHHGSEAAESIAPQRVLMAHDHATYYRAPGHLQHADFYFESRAPAFPDDLNRYDAPSVAEPSRVLPRLLAQGRAVYACDLTPPDAAILQGRMPLHVWRVFVPGLMPLWFGYGVEPLGLISAGTVDCDISPAGLTAIGNQPLAVHPCT